MIVEGSCKFDAVSLKIPTKQMDVFYNPVMKHNRDVFIALLDSLKDKKPLSIALTMEGTGVRGIRILKEVGVKHTVHFNDLDASAVTRITQNCRANKCPKRYTISQHDAELFLLHSQGYDVIDIDPFGSPISFIESACKRISRDGLLCVTATDTAALYGTYPSVCARRYGSQPLRCEQGHEWAVRILIHAVQKIAMRMDRAAIPVFCYAKDHYVRLYLRMVKSKEACDDLLKSHGWLSYDRGADCVSTFRLGDSKGLMAELCGPLYLGPLCTYDGVDKKKFFKKLQELHILDAQSQHWDAIQEEELDIVGFYHVSSLCRLYKVPQEPSRESLKSFTDTAGVVLTRTNFSDKGIKTNMPYSEFVNTLKNLRKKKE